MHANGVRSRHVRVVSERSAVDVLLFLGAFVIAWPMRLGGDPWADWVSNLSKGWPALFCGAASYVVALYVFGFYSDRHFIGGRLNRAVVLACCLSIAVAVMAGVFFMSLSITIGRGVMILGCVLAYLLGVVHHVLSNRQRAGNRERVALVVTCQADEEEIVNLRRMTDAGLELVGVVYADCPPVHVGGLRVLGEVGEMNRITEREEIDRVVCTGRGMANPRLYRLFCQLRYSGTVVVPMILLFEEFHQCCPVALVTPEWVLHASGSPHMFYIRKMKRAFDVVVSLLGLVLLGPLLLLGIALVKLTSRGPVLYRQQRCGRFGQLFEVLKLRTMRVDAEAETGAVWSSGAHDPRVTLAGGFMRKYRIDEIPQLFNVLRGEMSFVGPRPERPEFCHQLEREVPFFGERLLIQPGLTGWAQVNYPYGSSIDDARRKLEYDLYYMKNMGLLLDFLILLDTVRTVLLGGLGEAHRARLPEYVRPAEAEIADPPAAS